MHKPLIFVQLKYNPKKELSPISHFSNFANLSFTQKQNHNEKVKKWENDQEIGNSFQRQQYVHCIMESFVLPKICNIFFYFYFVAKTLHWIFSLVSCQFGYHQSWSLLEQEILAFRTSPKSQVITVQNNFIFYVNNKAGFWDLPWQILF